MSKNDQNGQIKIVKNGKNGPKWQKLTKNGQK